MSTVFKSYEGPRGLKGYVKFRDSHGNHIQVQQSSVVEVGPLNEANEDPLVGPFVWIFTDGHNPHLTIEQAKAVRDSLDQFIKDSE